MRRVRVIVDNESWILRYAEELVQWSVGQGDDARLLRAYSELGHADITFLLGCIRIAPEEVLSRSTHTLVAHASDLPEGKGFAPVQWQILAGAMMIPVCLLHAGISPDSGNIILRDAIELAGHELNDEIRRKQGEAAVRLCRRALQLEAIPAGTPQQGQGSTYPRRRLADSRLDPHKTIAEQFDLLRIVDNERYPAFFEYRSHTYRLRIEKLDD